MAFKSKSKYPAPAPAGRFNGFSKPADLPKGKKGFDAPKTVNVKGKPAGKAKKAAGNFGKTY